MMIIDVAFEMRSCNYNALYCVVRLRHCIDDESHCSVTSWIFNFVLEILVVDDDDDDADDDDD